MFTSFSKKKKRNNILTLISVQFTVQEWTCKTLMTPSLVLSPELHIAFLHLRPHLDIPQVFKGHVSKNKFTILDSKPITPLIPYQVMAPMSCPDQSQESHPLLLLFLGRHIQSGTYCTIDSVSSTALQPPPDSASPLPLYVFGSTTSLADQWPSSISFPASSLAPLQSSLHRKKAF